MQTCGICNKQSPDQVTTCPRCGSDLREKSLTSLALKNMQDNDRVRLVRVSVAADCCPACAVVQGSHPKDNVPALPVEGCSHPNGCRCFYEPVLTEIFP